MLVTILMNLYINDQSYGSYVHFQAVVIDNDVKTLQFICFLLVTFSLPKKMFNFQRGPALGEELQTFKIMLSIKILRDEFIFDRYYSDCFFSSRVSSFCKSK